MEIIKSVINYVWDYFYPPRLIDDFREKVESCEGDTIERIREAFIITYKEDYKKGLKVVFDDEVFKYITGLIIEDYKKNLTKEELEQVEKDLGSFNF